MVANNAELERSYLAARGHSEKPVLLSVEGHRSSFTIDVNTSSEITHRRRLIRIGTGARTGFSQRSRKSAG